MSSSTSSAESKNSSVIISSSNSVEFVTASGTTRDDAPSVSKNNIIITSENKSFGIRLMPPKLGIKVFVRNISANPCLIYPAIVNKIDASVDPIILKAGTGNILLGATDRDWVTLFHGDPMITDYTSISSSSSASSSSCGVEFVSATGSNARTAIAITKGICFVTSDNKTKGIRMMPPKEGQKIYVRNISAVSCLLYPAPGHRIDAMTTPIELHAGTGNILLGATDKDWISMF